MNEYETGPTANILVEHRGHIPEGADEYARAELRTVLDGIGVPVPAMRVKLAQAANPAAIRPAMAQAMMDVDGRLVRAHVAATTMSEAVDLLRDRLTARLARAGRAAPAGLGGVAAPGARQDGTGHARLPRFHPLPVEERRITRRRPIGLLVQTPEDAVFELASLNHEFRLFTDAATGTDSVVHRDRRTGRYHLSSVDGARARVRAEPWIDVSTAPVPRTTVAEASARLDITGLPFVFFRDAATGRGSVLYRRKGGRYGLITCVTTS
ncbi:sigma 54 modulation/S30EA ribosomal C-terminal domain-containing protein [Streptomyces sp. MUM 203J]|uniref:sigma 54 modulation/S30EA ribosomal C-terminal domain-containing protein n=1 Tax=Streptomyces sp. MUM 203J TaxID=2791990 RepID=UPI001F035420|nr:sigma 54 modulation/S30EA ribosomal C-terminal domain-containing protein [Streptomyces sp. MUM 203J]MCH0539716.1 sigma 54 modulation/S30EA ribosomal C-terminal domain-containing protein [Streptomyces sp. MUM 203J]